MAKKILFRKCVITGTLFGISHLIFGAIVYFIMIGISKKRALALICAFIFIILSIVFFIIGCQQFCSLQEDQFPFLISTATISLFASLSCFYSNENWLASKNIVNRIPFYLIIIASLHLAFTCAMFTFFKFLNFISFFPLFQKRGTILGKLICDLLISLILSFMYGFTYSNSNKKSTTSVTIFVLFAAIPCSFYTLVGFLLECYSQNIDDIAEPLAQM